MVRDDPYRKIWKAGRRSRARFRPRMSKTPRGAFALAALLSAIAGDAGATSLIFNESRDAATSTIVFPTGAGSNVQQDYGDRVTGSPMPVLGGTFTYGNQGEGYTPNVVVDYASGGNVALWTTQYGDLTNVLFASQGSDMLNVRLTADSGFDVLLYEFDLGGWPQSDYTIDGVAVTSGSSTLFSQSNVVVEGDATGPGHTSFAFASPLRAPELMIAVDFSNLADGQQDNIGIDNIRFGQDPPPAVIPVPAALPLLASAFALLALTARSKRRTADV